MNENLVILLDTLVWIWTHDSDPALGFGLGFTQGISALRLMSI